MLEKNKCHGSNDLSNRHLLKKATGRQKINMLLALNTEVEAINHKDLTDQAKSFKQQSLKPFMFCYTICCKSDPETFLRDCSGKFGHSKFICCHEQ